MTRINMERMKKKETEETLEVLREVLRYDPETGNLYWKVNVGSRGRKGTVAGYVRYPRWTSPRRYLFYKHVEYACHRLAWALYYGHWPGNEIDHINGDGLDNRIGNLRDVNLRQNGQNQVYHRNGGLLGALGSTHKGITYWHSRISIDGVQRYLGAFPTAREAHEAYMRALREHGYEALQEVPDGVGVETERGGIEPERVV